MQSTKNVADSLKKWLNHSLILSRGLSSDLIRLTRLIERRHVDVRFFRKRTFSQYMHEAP